jgi:D-tyrosyl-tRNA(Tyr) deacylase
MRFIIQRVNQACVTIKDKENSNKIGKGLLIYVGINQNDNEDSLDFIVDKLLNIKLFDGENEARWKESVLSLDLEILLISNFTLYCNFKGNKPNFNHAMDGTNAGILFGKLVSKLKEKYKEDKVKIGEFGEYMFIDSINDGPVTIDWEYPTEKDEEQKKNNNKNNKNNKKNKNDKNDSKNDKNQNKNK